MQVYKPKKLVKKGLTEAKLFDIIIKLTETNGTKNGTAGHKPTGMIGRVFRRF